MAARENCTLSFLKICIVFYVCVGVGVMCVHAHVWDTWEDQGAGCPGAGVIPGSGGGERGAILRECLRRSVDIPETLALTKLLCTTEQGRQTSS